MSAFPNLFDALLLIALGMGYIILCLAKKEEKQLRLLGYVIGWLIIVSVVIYMLCSLWIRAKMYHPNLRHSNISNPGTFPQVPPQPLKTH